LNSDEVILDYIGEKSLVWTTLDFNTAKEYAKAGFRQRGVVLELIVPKGLVKSRSGWPVLQIEDVGPTLEPFIYRVRWLGKASSRVLPNHR